MLNELQDGARTLGLILLAVVGGILGHITREINLGKKLVAGRSIFAGLAAGFVGLLVIWACEELKISPGYTGVIVGITSYLGTEITVNILMKWIYKRLGIEHGYTVVASKDTSDIVDPIPLVRKLSDVHIPTGTEQTPPGKTS